MSAFSPASPAARLQIVSIGKAFGLEDFHLDLWSLCFKDEANATDPMQARRLPGRGGGPNHIPPAPRRRRGGLACVSPLLSFFKKRKILKQIASE